MRRGRKGLKEEEEKGPMGSDVASLPSAFFLSLPLFFHL